MLLREYMNDGHVVSLELPEPDDELISGIKWGDPTVPFTPAYWRFACLVKQYQGALGDFRLGKSLEEEVIACLLGGYGIKGELGLAAYNHLCQHGVTQYSYSAEQIEDLLSVPLSVNGLTHKYRYPRQKAKYIFEALSFLRENEPPISDPHAFRNWLTNISGIGYKTASWITRNWLNADSVAILDIHIHRAGVLVGIFSPNEDVSKSYLYMEKKFVTFSTALGIATSVLDNQIWNELRRTPLTTRKMLIGKGVTQSDVCGLPRANNTSTSRNYNLFITSD